jgi:undecaprenyl-diphosphatase
MISFSLVDFDYRIFKIFNSLAGRSDAWDLIFVSLSEYILFLMLAGLALFILLQERDRVRWIAGLQALAAAFIGRALIVSLIRMFFFRSRPFIEAAVTQLVFHNPLEGSFPSGHATVMFALAFSLFFTNIRWGFVYLFLAMVSSLARVVVGVHFPLDIIGGMLVGALSAFLAKWFFDFWLRKRKIKEIKARG